jgi:hypothetical protein
MEIIKGAHDLAFVALLIAIALAPRAIATYLAVSKRISPFRKGK